MAELGRLLDAVHKATNKLASTGDTKAILREVLVLCVEAVGASGGTIYIHDAANKTLRFLHVLPEEVERKLERLDIPDDYGVAGQVFQTGESVISVFDKEGDPHNKIVRKTGVPVRTMMTVPLAIQGQKPVGVVQLVNKRDGIFDDVDAAVLDTISDVCTLAILNSRLMEQQLRVASLEGMGRAAHDLANKAGVLVTFLPDFQKNLDGLRHVLKEQDVKGEADLYLDLLEITYRDVFAPYSDRVFRYAKLINDLASGKPLLPKKRKQSFAQVVQEAAEFMETQARRNYIQIVYDLQRDAPDFEFDDLFVIRIVENLVGNAIKAARETVPPEWIAEHGNEEDAMYGQVTVRYRHASGSHVFEVIDDGPGMSPAVVRSILAGSARSHWETQAGSGLGMKVVLELVAAHGAKLAIRSKMGEGSTFEVEFPGPDKGVSTKEEKDAGSTKVTDKQPVLQGARK